MTPQTLPHRPLGKSGLSVPAIGFGCMGMSEFYGAARDDANAITVIHRSIDLGCNFLDTADMYGVGHNEELVGRAIAGRRDQIILATKFGHMRGTDGSFKGVCGTPDYVQSACEASLKRLNIETIDLYYQHRVDKNTPIEETVAAMASLVKQGKVRHLGLSEAAPATLRRAVKIHPIAALQTEYSLWSREPDEEIIPTCRQLGIGFVAYSPLGRGFLTGAFKTPDDLKIVGDNRQNFPRFQGENFYKNLEIVKKLQELAKKKSCTPGQLALAWVLKQGDDIIPIPGTRRIQYLEENLAALNVTLTDAELSEIDRILPSAAGHRYYERAQAALNG